VASRRCGNGDWSRGQDRHDSHTATIASSTYSNSPWATVREQSRVNEVLGRVWACGGASWCFF
jgi:hypothetical protein